MKAPHGWQEQSDHDGVLAAHAPQVDKDPTGENQAWLQVKLSSEQLDAAGQQQLMAKQFNAQGFGGYHSTEQPQQVTVNGVKGVYFGGTFTYNNTLMRTRVYLFPVKSKTCIVTFTCLASKWGGYERELEASVKSLSLKN